MKIPTGGKQMNWKSYAIIGGIVIVGVIVAMKMIKFEGTAVAGEGTSTVTSKVKLKPSINTSSKEA